MTKNTASNTPVETLWDGSLKATVWQNTSETGKPYHTISLSRLYEDRAGKPQETNSFSTSELLRVAELAREAYAAVLDIRRHFAEQAIEHRSPPTKPANGSARSTGYRQRSPTPR